MRLVRRAAKRKTLFVTLNETAQDGDVGEPGAVDPCSGRNLDRDRGPENLSRLGDHVRAIPRLAPFRQLLFGGGGGFLRQRALVLYSFSLQLLEDGFVALASHKQLAKRRLPAMVQT